jgi:hexosaminidase
MSWRGISGAVVAAKAGHDTVLSPAPFLYLDNRQSGRPEEPSGRGFVLDLKTVYAFDPIPAALSEEERKHILGLQANLWTEHIRTDDHAGWMAFPRAAAVAETGWSPKSAHDWADFSTRMPTMMDRYRALGFNAADSGFAVEVHQDTGAAPGQAIVTLSTQIGLGDIRYTTDGSAPTPASAVYSAPLTLPTPTRIKAAAFKDGQAISAVADRAIDELSVRRKTSQQLKSCAAGLGLNLEDDGPLVGDRAVFLVDIMNPCWIYPQADLTGVSRLSASVGQVPFNFQIGADKAKIVLHPPRTADGELEVRLDSCTGEVIASLPLDPATASTGVTTLTADLTPRTGRHDLCFTFTSKRIDPMSVLNWVQLVPAKAAKAG